MTLLPLLWACVGTAADDTATDDTAGDSGTTTTDTGLPPASCALGSAAMVVQLGGGAAVSLDIAAEGDWDLSATAQSVNVTVRNSGSVDLTGLWGGCADTALTLVDATGAVVWTEPESSQSCTVAPFDLAVGDTTTLAEQLDIRGTPPGSYLLSARTLFEVDQGDHTATLGYEIGLPVNLGVGACPAPGATAHFPTNGLAVTMSTPALPFDSTSDIELAAEGTPDAALAVLWSDCGWPRFGATDASGTELWTGSLADLADCSLAEGWPAGETREGRYDVPAGTWEVGGSGRAHAWFTEYGEPQADTIYEVSVGVTTE